jgi:arylsulfatase A-like enzyme
MGRSTSRLDLTALEVGLSGHRSVSLYVLVTALFLAATWTAWAAPATGLGKPNVILILADDLGYSDLGCYGSSIRTPNLDALAAQGVRFSQFYNMARCCPTRASLLTGLYNHQAGVGHMTQDWDRFGPAYSGGLNQRSATFAELLQGAGYGTYLAGKWHVGGFGRRGDPNYPTRRGFDRYYGTSGGGDFFRPSPLRLDDQEVIPGDDYYFTDAISEYGVRFLQDHGRARPHDPFLLHLCYTAPHFPLHARPDDIARYRGKFRHGWDVERERRLARQKELGLLGADTALSPRDPVAQPWSAVQDVDEWDLRMAVHAAMIDRMDQGIGKVMETVREMGVERNTLVLFLSDNGASAEALDSWPNPARGHKPGTPTGAPNSHRCLEIGWANAANTPFRECKMWNHEGGIATPLIASWPARLKQKGLVTHEVGSVIDLAPTLLAAAGASYPARFRDRDLTPLEGRDLLPAMTGGDLGRRTLFWEHEGNRAVRQGDWKLVAEYGRPWELYDLARDRTETRDLAAQDPARVGAMTALWQSWADRVGVVPWKDLPGSSYRPRPGYRRKSEPPIAD